MSTPKFSMHQKVHRLSKFRGEWRVSGEYRITDVTNTTHPYYYLNHLFGMYEENIFSTLAEAKQERDKRNIITELRK